MSNLGRVTRFGAFVSIAIASVFMAGAAFAEPDQGSIAGAASFMTSGTRS